MITKHTRRLDGILVLDKALGITSNRALQQVKHLFRAKKAGHTGSLDPLATGVLPVCFGEATKISRFLLDADKSYQASICLGIKTDTGDAEGRVIERREIPDLDEEIIKLVFADFTGVIQQVPPIYSAIKKEGKPLYSYARSGQAVEVKSRPVSIHELELVALGPQRLEIKVRCSKGTYIRTLAEDIAAALGTLGHLGSLRRLNAGSFSLEKAVTFKKLEEMVQQEPSDIETFLHGVDSALDHLPEVVVENRSVTGLQQGKTVALTQTEPCAWVRIYSDPDRIFLGMGEVTDGGLLAPRRMMNRELVC